MASLPPPRGVLSHSLTAALTGPFQEQVQDLPTDGGFDHDDAAISLWVLHQLHYRGFDGVDERWEWHPDLHVVRWLLEGDLEERLRKRMPLVRRTDDVVADIRAVVADSDGPSLARHLQQRGTREQALDLLRQRSLYHLQEADATSLVVPRLPGGRAKAALLEIQFDEYGAGSPARLHHDLFARGMAASGLVADPGHYAAEAIPEVLEQNNALTLFGLQRRLRGAALGHLAVFEATSSIPSRQLVQGLDRLGMAQEVIAYYNEHVEADAVHEQLALRDVCAAAVEAEPALAEDVLLGAWTCLDLETRTAEAMLRRWGVA